MKIHEIINPIDHFTTMKRDGTFKGNNDRDIYYPCLNLRCWHFPELNPKGPMPLYNPEHYIHPLTGYYANGPLDFSRI